MSIDITSSKWPCTAQSFTIKILPSCSMIVGFNLADFFIAKNFVRAASHRESAAGFQARISGTASP